MVMESIRLRAIIREDKLKPRIPSKKSWLLGSAALALAVSAPAYAQDAPVTDEDEEATLDVITVTGIRGAIQNSRVRIGESERGRAGLS